MTDKIPLRKRRQARLDKIRQAEALERAKEADKTRDAAILDWAASVARSITDEQRNQLAEICLIMAPAKFEIAGRVLREARNKVTEGTQGFSDKEILALIELSDGLGKELDLEADLRDLWRDS